MGGVRLPRPARAPTSLPIMVGRGFRPIPARAHVHRARSSAPTVGAPDRHTVRLLHCRLWLMYWPSASARRVSAAPAGLVAPQADHLSASRDGALWLAMTPDALLVWSMRPCALVAAVVRSARSVEAYGANVHAAWRGESDAIVIQVCIGLSVLTTDCAGRTSLLRRRAAFGTAIHIHLRCWSSGSCTI